MKKPEESDGALQVKHRHGNSVTTFKYACVHKSIRYIVMREKKTPIYKLFRSKTPKTQQICHYRHVRKTSGPFLLYAIHLGSFAKVSVPVETTIS